MERDFFFFRGKPKKKQLNLKFVAVSNFEE